MRRRPLNFSYVYLLFLYYLSYEKVVILHLNKMEPPFPTDALCQVCSNLPLKKKMKIITTTTTMKTTTTTDNGQISIRKVNLSLLLRWPESIARTHTNVISTYYCIIYLLCLKRAADLLKNTDKYKNKIFFLWVKLLYVQSSFFIFFIELNLLTFFDKTFIYYWSSRSLK